MQPSPVQSRARPSVIKGLALACHPLPTLAVTALSAGLAALAGVPLGRATLLVLAVFAGQLSIGWCNDAVDADRDVAVARTDKPVAAGAVARTVVGSAAVVALVVALGLAVVLGRPGWMAFVLVVAGWSYNLGLKRTALSFLPYAVGFGSLPSAATWATATPGWAAWWATAAAACLGVAAHLGNVLPDLDDDADTGVRGLPHRLGRAATSAGIPVVLVAGSACIVTGAGFPITVRIVVVAVAVIIGTVAALAGIRRAGGALPFLATIAVAVGDLVLFAVSGSSLR